MPFKENLNSIIFGTNTKAGKRFDVFLLFAILLSVLFVMLESVPSFNEQYGNIFVAFELFFTIFFTLEYALRIYISPKPLKYITSFWGVIDLLSILPTYLGIFYSNYRFFRAIRIFRLLRAFTILNLKEFTGESNYLAGALMASRSKILVFLSFILTVVCCMGTIMYVVEGADNGFTTIPQSIYWSIVTITTVGYGDIAPATVLGKVIASLSMIIGYAIIAIPTGIVTSEFQKAKALKNCKKCDMSIKKSDRFCFQCGTKQ